MSQPVHADMLASHYGGMAQIVRALSGVLIEPAEIQLGKWHYTLPAVERALISPTFFRSMPCLGCGRCCHLKQLLIWPEGDSRGMHGESQLEKFMVGNFSSGYYYLPQPQKWCQFSLRASDDFEMNSVRCGIHSLKPIHCALPHIQLRRRGNRGYLLKGQYGRNHLFGCPSPILPFDLKELREVDIPQLVRLHGIARGVGLKTCLIMVINELEKVSASGVPPIEMTVAWEVR